MVGRVVGPAGALAANAAVVLVSSPAGGPACGASDTVAVAADARGRFVAQLLPQETYSAWACGGAAGGDSAGQPCSEVAEDVAAGRDVELRLDHRGLRFGVELQGAAAWAVEGPLRVDVAPGAANVAFVPLAADGRSPLLPDVALVLVRDGRGEPLWCCPAPHPDEQAVLHVALPAPLALAVEVVDAAGAPVVGATVWTDAVGTPLYPSRMGGTQWFDRAAYRLWRSAGVTGADGAATVRVVPPAAGFANLRVRGPDGAETTLVTIPNETRTAYVGGQKQTAGPDGRFRAALQAPVRLRILDRGAPAAVDVARLTASYVGQVAQELSTALPNTPGDVVVPLPPGPVETMLAVRSVGDPHWNLLRLPLQAGVTATVDLSWQRTVALQFVDTSGGPARGFSGVLCAVGSKWAGNQQVVVSTDQSGRLERRLGADAWFLFVTDGVQWGRYDVPVHKGPAAPPTFRETVVCRPFPSARVRTLDAAGSPVAGVHLDTFYVPNGTTADPVAAVLGNLLPRIWRRLATDAEGVVVLPCGIEERAATQCIVRNPGGRDHSLRIVAGEELDVEVARPDR